MGNNLSLVKDYETATTREIVAWNRAQNLANLEIKRVIELCVGPSLRSAERHYKDLGIGVVGNDVDPRWQAYYPQGKWLIGDALSVPLVGFDAAVFGPPLSRGCTGQRVDSLSIDAVTPNYRDFMLRKDLPDVTVLVLPGRSLATKKDRKQFHALCSFIQNLGRSFVFEQMKDEKGKVTKYVDVYVF